MGLRRRFLRLRLVGRLRRALHPQRVGVTRCEPRPRNKLDYGRSFHNCAASRHTGCIGEYPLASSGTQCLGVGLNAETDDGGDIRRMGLPGQYVIMSVLMNYGYDHFAAERNYAWTPVLSAVYVPETGMCARQQHAYGRHKLKSPAQLRKRTSQRRAPRNSRASFHKSARPATRKGGREGNFSHPLLQS